MIDFNKTLELASQNTQKKIQSNEILPTASKNSNILPTANKKVQNMQNRVLKTAQYSAKQQALQKQRRKEEEEKAWNNLKALENSYQEKDKWLLANLDQNNTVLGTVTDEYREKYEEKRQAEEAYMNAFSNYYNEYREEYDQRLKEYNQKTTEQFLETAKGIGSNIATGVTRGINSVGNFVKENAPALLSNKYYTQQEMADYEQKYGITESSKQEILEKYKNEYGTLEEALTAVTKEKSKLQQMHEDIGGWGMFYDKEDYEERERNIERLKYERDLISESLGKASVPDNIAEVGKSLLDVADVGEFFDSFGGDLVQPLNQIGDAGEEAFGEMADLYAQKSPKIAGLAENVGSLIPAMVATAVSGNTAVGTAVFAAKAKNDYYHEYLDQGYTATEADNLSNIMTVVEVGSEYLGDIAGGVNILKKGALKDWASKPLSQAIKGYAIEGGEEVFAEVAGMIVTDEKLTTEEFSDRVKSAFAGGVALSIVMNGVGKAGSTIAKCKEKLTNGQKLTMSEVEQVIQEQASIEGKSVEEIMDEYGDKVNEIAQSSTANTAENKTLPTANQEATTVADVLPTASEQKTNNTESTMLPTAKDNVLPTANKQNVENVATKNNKVTTNLQEEIGLSISNDNMLPYANSENLAVKKYQYVESDNTKINDIRKDASQYFTDSEQAHKFIETLEKVIVDKDLAIRLNDNVRTEDNKIANGKYDSGTITIDPSSPKALESIAIHEATHAIGTKSMLKIVDTYRKSDAEFNSNVQALLDNYNVTELNEEVLADVSSELFGTQEFINNVADAHPTLFQKIYSEIKYLWHQFRGYKTQGQFIEDLYFKWNQAYNSSNKLNNTTNYHVSENFSNEIDKALNNQLKTNTQVKARDFTPQILVDNGVENLPMLITQKHIKSIIYTLQEAENLGLPTKDTNYHGLGKDLLIKAIDNLDNPQAIYKTNENNYLVVTEFKDSNGKEIVVPIQINGNGRYNDVFIAENQIKSVYGRNNLDNYIGRNNFEQIYKKNKELDFNEGIQYSNVANSSIDNSIAPQNNDVNTTTKYSTQESENNTTKLQDRISGDKLLDTQDFINEIKSVGAEVDENGYVTVYHQTSTENANKIKESGMMSGKEDGIFFSTSKEAQQSEGRGTEKLTFKIPAEILQLDDIFDNNADVRIPLKNKNEIIDVSKYLINTENSSSTNYLLNKEESLPKVKEGYTRLYRGLENEYNPNYDKTLLDNNNGYESWTDNYDLAKSYGENVYYIDVPTSEIKNSVINEDASSETYGDRNLIYLNDKPVGIKGKSGNEYMLYTDHENYNDIVYNKVDVNETTSDIRYSKKSNNSWQKYLEENFRAKGTRTYAKDILFQTSNESKSTPSKDILVKKADSENSYTKMSENKKSASVVDNKLETGKWTAGKEKVMNPTEISNLKLEDADTTPKLYKKNYKKGDKQSSFLSNITETSKFLNENLREEMAKEDNIRYYEGITNKETLEKAYNKLQNGGTEETMRWYSKKSQNANAEDVAEGWILLKQYQDEGDYESAVEVAKKMRDIGTAAGQTVQAYNILSRLTPEGMFYYAQAELNEAYAKMVEGKSKKWIEENRFRFDLTPEETKSILDIMKNVSTMEDGYDKRVKIAEVQKIITDKIPPTTGQSIKAWMRISMLFNPKTQVRNIMGNAVIAPVNILSDSISTFADRAISSKTGVRTTGNINIKSYGKGFGKGLYESYNDFKKGINTRSIQDNKFEVSGGKSFNNRGVGKALNRVDSLLSFMLDAGDRGFYEATFTNSINNQMILNDVTAPTQEMIDIATNEALQRTWQDNNNYTKSVLTIRNILNSVNIKGYGLGDVIIPFAKTPANLTKAIVDYSPVGLVKTLTLDAKKIKNSLQNGQYSPQLQHQFVQNLGKAMAGSFLYVLSYGLAKAGIASGEADEDKDVKNFMKNSLGISSYSIKIGDKTFSYDWTQPVATPLAIMTNYVKYSEENPDANAIEKAIKAMNIGTEQLLQQSFMESLNTVLNGSGTTLENLAQAVLELPARAIPTFSKQIADMVDGTQRTSFEYDKPAQSAINSVLAKIPYASRTLPASVDTLGNEIQKYGGKNNLWNVMFNPANTNKGNLSKAGQEIYNVYKETGDTTIFPRTAPYYINNEGKKIIMTSEQRNKFQSVTGQYVENSLKALLNDSEYKQLSYEKKANVINQIVSDSYSKAKYDVLNIDSDAYQKLRTTLEKVKPSTYYNYKFKTQELKKDNEKIKVLIDSDYSNKEKMTLYEIYFLPEPNTQSSQQKNQLLKYETIKSTFTSNGLDITQYLEYKSQEFTSDKDDDGTVNGKTISGSKKQKVHNYIESMKATYTQKLILSALEYEPSSYSDKKLIVNYVNSLNKTAKEKLEILGQFKGVTVYKNGTYSY